MLTRDSFIGVDRAISLPRKQVAVPELGGHAFVRMMTASERDRFELQVADGKRMNFRARIVAFCACDQAGVNLFTEADIPALGKLPASDLTVLADEALRINKFTSDDVKELEGNCVGGQSEGSPSDSPPISA